MICRGSLRKLFYVLCLYAAVSIALAVGNASANSLMAGNSAAMFLLPIGQTADSSACEAELDSFTTRQYHTIDVHRAFGLTTAGLLLAADGMGLYHFLRMVQRGHELRDRIGFTEESIDRSPQTVGVKNLWADNRSQTERLLHTGLIIAGSLSYTATATMKLATPRTSKSQAAITDTKLHHYAFYLHAGLMAANVALGLVESSALADGNHDLLVGAGIAHIVVGFSVPVLILGAGGIFKLPLDY